MSGPASSNGQATVDVAIIGAGYVGLTTAACLAHLGRRVVAVDVDGQKIATLSQGEVPILEAGLDALVGQGLDSGHLEFSTDHIRAAVAPVIMLCLPTPYRTGDGLDLGYVEAAAASLSPVLLPGTIVATKSTVPVGTHRKLEAWLERDDLHVAANPEFLREGTAVRDFLAPDRIVIGAADDRIGRAVADLYRGVDAPIQITDPTSAELIKYAANAFLAGRLSFVNEMSRLCDRLGGDVTAVMGGLGTDHRIGSHFLQPGPGWGGSCFPKDTRGLTDLARQADLDLPVAAAAHSSNQIHLDHTTDVILRLCRRRPDQARIAVWGATFKAATNDTRESPALAIMHRLRRSGATVVAYDPVAPSSDVPTSTVEDPYSACRDADLLVVLTEWPEFASTDLEKVARLLAAPLVYDTRSVIDAAAARAAGLELHRTGRPAVTP